MIGETELACDLGTRPGSVISGLSVVIPTFNGLKYLPKCLESIVAESLTIGERVDVLVVDNGSTDDTIAFVERHFPAVQVLALGANQGFAEACDRGIRTARGRHCLLFNNDAWFAPGSLAELLAYAKAGDFAFTGPKILNPDGTLQWGPISLDFLGDPSHGPANRPPFCVTGAAILIRRSDYLELGGFDRRFFAFHEDLDLQWRARLWGKRIGYTPDAQVYHIGGATLAGAVPIPGQPLQTSRKRLYLGRRNQLASLLMNHSAAALSWVLPMWLLSGLVECIGARVSGYGGQANIYLAALAWNIRNSRRTWLQRQSIQMRRRVPDEMLFPMFGPAFSRLRLAVRLVRAETPIRTSDG